MTGRLMAIAGQTDFGEGRNEIGGVFIYAYSWCLGESVNEGAVDLDMDVSMSRRVEVVDIDG